MILALLLQASSYSWEPIVAAAISVAGAGCAAYLGSSRAAARSEGVITTKIEEVGGRLDRHEKENSDRFKTIESDNAKQWEVIRETQQEVGYLQGKANRKAAER